MTANEHVKDRDEKKDQLSPQFEKVPVIKKSENEEAIPSYRQLNEWLAAMTANEHVKDTQGAAAAAQGVASAPRPSPAPRPPLRRATGAGAASR